jgi:hypothetical protein
VTRRRRSASSLQKLSWDDRDGGCSVLTCSSEPCPSRRLGVAAGVRKKDVTLCTAARPIRTTQPAQSARSTLCHRLMPFGLGRSSRPSHSTKMALQHKIESKSPSISSASSCCSVPQLRPEARLLPHARYIYDFSFLPFSTTSRYKIYLLISAGTIFQRISPVR